MQNVVADEMCECADGIAIRRITYHDEVNDRTFVFLTNLPKTVAPGLVAYLYKCRWDIEKVFDELPWVHEAIQRITQRSVKFIRWLRNHLDSQASWEQALRALTRICAKL